MVVTAATFYRLINIAKHMSRTQMNDLMAKMALINPAKHEVPSFVPRRLAKSPGEW